MIHPKLFALLVILALAFVLVLLLNEPEDYDRWNRRG
jgi:hypothetical protein